MEKHIKDFEQSFNKMVQAFHDFFGTKAEGAVKEAVRFVDKYRVWIAIGAVAIVLIGITAIINNKEENENQLSKTYSTMQTKRYNIAEGVADKYESDTVSAIKANVYIQSVLANTPEYQSLQDKASELENKTPSPLLPFAIGILILIFNPLLTEFIAFVFTKINWFEFGEEKKIVAKHLFLIYLSSLVVQLIPFTIWLIKYYR